MNTIVRENVAKLTTLIYKYEQISFSVPFPQSQLHILKVMYG